MWCVAMRPCGVWRGLYIMRQEKVPRKGEPGKKKLRQGLGEGVLGSWGCGGEAWRPERGRGGWGGGGGAGASVLTPILCVPLADLAVCCACTERGAAREMHMTCTRTVTGTGGFGAGEQTEEEAVVVQGARGGGNGGVKPIEAGWGGAWIWAERRRDGAYMAPPRSPN